MPSTAIVSANSGKGGEAGPYKAPHERKAGPWDDYELEDGGHTMMRAEEIKSNPAYVEAIAKHHEKKAKKHRKLASGMRDHMKRGLVSESAIAKVAK